MRRAPPHHPSNVLGKDYRRGVVDRPLEAEPQDFSVSESLHREDGRSIEGGFGLDLAPLTLDAAISRYDNDGSFPFTLDRGHVRAEVALSTRTSIIGEWSRDRYRA